MRILCRYKLRVLLHKMCVFEVLVNCSFLHKSLPQDREQCALQEEACLLLLSPLLLTASQDLCAVSAVRALRSCRAKVGFGRCVHSSHCQRSCHRKPSEPADGNASTWDADGDASRNASWNADGNADGNAETWNDARHGSDGRTSKTRRCSWSSKTNVSIMYLSFCLFVTLFATRVYPFSCLHHFSF